MSPEVREAGELVAVVRRRHADHVWQVVCARVRLMVTSLSSPTPSPPPLPAATTKSVSEAACSASYSALRALGAAEAGVHDLQALMVGIRVGGDQVGHLPWPEALSTRRGTRPTCQATPATPDAVVAPRAHRAGHVRAVPVLVVGVSLSSGHPVPAAVVVDVAVGVVVDPVGLAPGSALAGVGPDVRREVGLGVVDAGVEDPHGHGRIPGGEVPRLRGVDVRVDRAGHVADRLPRVVESPEQVGEGVVGVRKARRDTSGSA